MSYLKIKWAVSIFQTQPLIYLADDILVSKEYILVQLERAKGHLERLCIDTYLKITELLLKKVRAKARGKAVISLETQIALKVKELRMTDKSLTFEQKCSGFRELIKMQEEIIANKI